MNKYRPTQFDQAVNKIADYNDAETARSLSAHTEDDTSQRSLGRKALVGAVVTALAFAGASKAIENDQRIQKIKEVQEQPLVESIAAQQQAISRQHSISQEELQKHIQAEQATPVTPVTPEQAQSLPTGYSVQSHS